VSLRAAAGGGSLPAAAPWVSHRVACGASCLGRRRVAQSWRRCRPTHVTRARTLNCSRHKLIYMAHATSTPAPFTSASSADTLISACERAGLDPAGASLIRFGTNANYRLAAYPIMVRIAPGHMDVVQKELAVARWLARNGFPAGRVAEEIRQPLQLGGRIVTFWELIEAHEEPARVSDLARLLHGLHQLPAPAAFTLPLFDPFDHTVRRLESAGDGQDARFLRSRSDALREQYANLEFALPMGMIHADAHEQNALRDRSGTVVLLDFEACAWGPREWDLGVLAMRYQPFGWISQDEYGDCVAAYGGFDITAWPGYKVLADIRALSMTSWLLQKADQSPAHAAELRKRMADLREDRPPRDWRAL
jgi:Phosphotransferase enzyme family